MGLIQTGNAVFPVEGLDPNDFEALKAMMPDFAPKQFIFPFLAHALGTLLGAFIAAKVAATRKMTMAMVIGGIFFIGGILVNQMLPGPTWFTILDLVVAYIPMAWIGGKMGAKS